MADGENPDSERTASLPNQPPDSSAWHESVVREYEARVEPFTKLFVQDMLQAIITEKQQQAVDRSTSPVQLLDVGCGTGCAAILAAQQGLAVTATDISPGMVQHLQERAEQLNLSHSIQCLLADGQHVSQVVPRHSFDFAMAAFSVIFFPEPTRGLQEIYQCLKNDGGKVALSAWGNAEQTPAFQIFNEAFRAVKPILADQGKPKRITGSVSVLQTMLQDAGFQDIVIQGPVAHNVHVASPQAYYDRFALTSPNIRAFLAQLSPEEVEQVHSKVCELAEARGGGYPDGSISIPSSAYYAYGTKRVS